MRILLAPEKPSGFADPFGLPHRVLIVPIHSREDVGGGSRSVERNASGDSGRGFLQLAERSTAAAMQGAVRFWALGYCGQLGLRIIRIDRVALQSIHNSGNCNKQLHGVSAGTWCVMV